VSRTWLEELTSPQCAELLAISWIGRLAVMVGDHPEVFPVNQAFDPMTGDIAFPSRTGTKLHAASLRRGSRSRSTASTETTAAGGACW
jgi:nitroimidazol reductase NimA-like FMN-containing flavoprotein (pyridoxamine 5'-phosphate oxidase superfamily)